MAVKTDAKFEEELTCQFKTDIRNLTNLGVKFEGKLTCAFKNDMRNLANFKQSMLESLKSRTFIGLFYQSRKCMSIKLTGDLFVMAMKNDAKFEEELTCQLKTEMRNLTNFDLSPQQFQTFAL